MKELTIGEKAKAYDEALERAKEIIECSKNSESKEVRMVFSFFPELKESEDERIKKFLIQMTQNGHGGDKDWWNKCVAWLYKQGEQKPVNKVEPKFKVDDYIIDVQGVETNKIIGYEDDSYLIRTSCSQFYLPMKLTEKNYRLWDIQKDAKDGDILACGNDIVIFKKNNYNPKDGSGCMFVYCSCNNLYEIGGINPTDYKPATKEQRDLLFQKMKEAGYEWDAEKKELKKIEQKPAEWSHIDENRINNICDFIQGHTNFADSAKEAAVVFLKSLKDRVLPQPKQEWSEEDEVIKKELISYLISKKSRETDGYAIWLKSLRPQNTWKPSDEQINALNYVVNLMASSERPTENDLYYNILKSLRQQLKKLKE